jgi:hypothetical protein
MAKIKGNSSKKQKSSSKEPLSTEELLKRTHFKKSDDESNVYYADKRDLFKEITENLANKNVYKLS